MNLSDGDSLWIDSKISQSLKTMKLSMNLILLKLPSNGQYVSCSVEGPVKTTLVDIGSCSIDPQGLVTSGSFRAPVDGVYKSVYNGKIFIVVHITNSFYLSGVMKVVGEGKVHANILKKNSTGNLETQVAGFTKLSSETKNELHGAYLAVSESITSYVRYNMEKPREH